MTIANCVISLDKAKGSVIYVAVEEAALAEVVVAEAIIERICEIKI